MSSIRSRIVTLAATLVFGTVGSICAAPASFPNDAVLEWNQIALDATVKAGQGPVPQIRTMAIVHVSVHDAVNAIAGDYKTYLRIQAEPAGASPEAAAIAAAHRALVGLFPNQAPDLNPLRAASLVAWFMLYAPANTPAPVLAKLRDAVNQAVANPEVKAKLAAQGLEVPQMKPDELASFGRVEIAKWSELVKRSGAQVD